MTWLRKLIVRSFSSLLLLALVGGAVSYILNAAFSTPVKIEQWLGQGQLYENIVAMGVNQINSVNDSGAGGLASINADDPLVQQAIRDSFPKPLLTQSIATFLDANYAWLQGKTNKPQFRIDLTAPTAAFAKQISQSVADHLAGVPNCTRQQLAQLVTTDLLHIVCRPAGISPTFAATLIEQQIAASDYAAHPVITADTLNPTQGGITKTKPYYQAVSFLPTTYKIAQKLPLVFAGLGLFSLAGLFVAAPNRRKVWQILARVLIVASLLLSIGRVVYDISFNKLQNQFFNNTTAGQLQQYVSDVAHQAINYITHLDLLGGAVYLFLAVMIIIGLLLTRKKRTRDNSFDDNQAATSASDQKSTENFTTEEKKAERINGKTFIQ
jgi:hypothetical protein